MRRGLLILFGIVAGCPAPQRYAVMRPGLTCERATRVAYRTMLQLGYTVTDITRPNPEQPGFITATTTTPEGGKSTVWVRISCGHDGAVLQPIEEGLFPTFEFSRIFGYSFTSLVQRPDIEEAAVSAGLQVRLHALGRQDMILDLGGEATLGPVLLVRVTVRNDTDRAVAIDPTRLLLAPAGGDSAEPLAGPALSAALAPGPAGDQVRAAPLKKSRVAPHTVANGYLVYPGGTYREAQVAIEDVETEETEGFVVPVE